MLNANFRGVLNERERHGVSFKLSILSILSKPDVPPPAPTFQFKGMLEASVPNVCASVDVPASRRYRILGLGKAGRIGENALIKTP